MEKELLTIKAKKSKYNGKKTITFCEIQECSNLADHTHHILEQQYADENGFVGHVRVHHVANCTHALHLATPRISTWPPCASTFGHRAH